MKKYIITFKENKGYTISRLLLSGYIKIPIRLWYISNKRAYRSFWKRIYFSSYGLANLYLNNYKDSTVDFLYKGYRILLAYDCSEEKLVYVWLFSRMVVGPKDTLNSIKEVIDEYINRKNEKI